MALVCNAHVHVNLCMVGLCWMPHPNQDSQASIKSYDGALKRWFYFETKALRGCYIDQLVWKLTMIVAWHYMHQTKMKRQGFKKNKVVAWLVATNVEKTLLIPHTNVIHRTLVGEDNVSAWMLQSQHHPNVIYNLHAPSLNMHLAHVSGHYVGICVNIRLLFSWYVPTLFRTILLTIIWD